MKTLLALALALLALLAGCHAEEHPAAAVDAGLAADASDAADAEDEKLCCEADAGDDAALDGADEASDAAEDADASDAAAE